MDALELLAEDHKLVNELFETMEAAEDERKNGKSSGKSKLSSTPMRDLKRRYFTQ